MTLAPGFFVDVFKIVLIDLTLAGDNALVIALAVRSPPARQRRIGSAVGAAAAVVLRALITIAAVKLLDVPYIKLAGGAFVLYIAVKVFVDAGRAGARRGCAGSYLASHLVYRFRRSDNVHG